MSGIAIIAPNHLKPKGSKLNAKQKNDIKELIIQQHPYGYSVSRSIEEFLKKINSANSYDEIPDKLSVSYENLISRNIDFKDTYDLINLTLRLASNRFNKKPKEILITGHAGYSNIALTDCEKLIAAGFVGCTLTPMIHGTEAAEESVNRSKKDPSYWSHIATPDKKIITSSNSVPLEITLTFRQEQIFSMICKGMTNYQIARRLSLSESTVKMHVSLILKKYKVKTRMQLVTNMY